MASNGPVKPSRPPSRLLQAALFTALVALGFVTLRVRLAVTEEGYRLSSLKTEIASLQEDAATLRLEIAQLRAHQRLRALAAKFDLGPPARGQVVRLP